MNHVYCYYANSGQIVMTATNQPTAVYEEVYMPQGLAVLGTESDEPQTKTSHTHYILDGELTRRPPSPVTRTDLTLHGVPNGATLFINGESYAADGTVELEFPLPGTYALRVECFPFLDWTDEVTG